MDCAVLVIVVAALEPDPVAGHIVEPVERLAALIPKLGANPNDNSVLKTCGIGQLLKKL